MKKHFDVIIVGAGPAGSAAAITLARKGAKVLCLERGDYPGAKNVSGGVFYGEVLKELLPDDFKEAPLERKIAKHIIVIAGKEDVLSFSHQRVNNERPASGYSVLRKKLDGWLSRQAEKAGARVLTDAPVDDIIWKNEQAVGVKVRRAEGEVFSDLVVLADGVNSLLSKKAGLRPEFKPGQMLLAVKEVIGLPKDVIEARFNLNEEGIAHLMVGDTTDGLEGGAFLYTNQQSLSLGLACHMDALIREKVKIHDLLERLKQIEWVSKFIDGGSLKEYSAHLIPTIGFKERPGTVGNGILVAGDAAGLTLNNGWLLRGMDFAMASGMAAAETCLGALDKGEFSRKTLRAYEERLKESFALKDMETFQGVRDILKRPSLYSVYPALFGDLFSEIFTVSGEPRKKASRLLWNRLRQDRLSTRFVRDLFKLTRSI